MPRADATELAPKKSAHPPACHIRAREGFSSRTKTNKKACISLVKLPSGRPWAIKRDARPAAFAGRFRMDSPGGIHVCAYTGEYPIPPPPCPWLQTGHSNLRNQADKSVRASRGKNVTRYTIVEVQCEFVCVWLPLHCCAHSLTAVCQRRIRSR